MEEEVEDGVGDGGCFWRDVGSVGVAEPFLLVDEFYVVVRAGFLEGGFVVVGRKYTGCLSIFIRSFSVGELRARLAIMEPALMYCWP